MKVLSHRRILSLNDLGGGAEKIEEKNSKALLQEKKMSKSRNDPETWDNSTVTVTEKKNKYISDIFSAPQTINGPPPEGFMDPRSPILLLA